MPKFAAHEAEDGAQVQAWHDEAYAEYEAALAAYDAATSSDKPSELIDPKIKANYVEARDTLIAGVQYWRQVGEQVGTRTGIVVEDNTHAPDEEG